MEYKINNFNLADISFDDAKSLSDYFEKSIYGQNLHYLLVGPNIIYFKYGHEKKILAEENKKIMNTLCRLVLFNLAIKSEQTVVMQTTSNVCAKSYIKKICKDLNVLINEKIKKENFSEISKLMLYYDYISFFTTLKDDFNDEISICDYIIRMYYSEGELFFDSIETVHENFGIICEKSEKFNNLNIFYMLIYNLPLEHLGSFLLCDRTKEYFNVFSEQIEVEDFIKRYLFINQFSLLQNKTQFENFIQSESNVDKIRNEFEHYKNLYSSYNKIKSLLGIKPEEERKMFGLFFGILLVNEYDIFKDPKAKNIIDRVTNIAKQVESLLIIRSCLISDFKFRINSKSKIFEEKNDENINILQKIALNLNLPEEKMILILLSDIKMERINIDRQCSGRIRKEFIKTIYEIFLDKIKKNIRSRNLDNKQENEHNSTKSNRLSFLVSRANQVYVSSYVSTFTFSNSNLPRETSRDTTNDCIRTLCSLYQNRNGNEPNIITVDKSIREAIYSNYLQELKNFFFFNNAVNISGSLKESSTLKIEYNNSFVDKLVTDVYNYKQLIDLYENNAMGLLLLMEDCSYLPIFIHQFRTKFHKNNAIELYDKRYLKVKHTFGTFIYDLTELFKETVNWNNVRTYLKAIICQYLNYSPTNRIDTEVSEFKRLANEVVYMNFLIKVNKYKIKDVIDDFKIGNIYFFYNNFFNYNLNMSEIRKNLLKNAKNQFENSKFLKNDYVLFKSQIAKKFRISELDYFHENGFVYARKNFSRILDFNKNIANLVFKYNHRMFYFLAVKNVLSSNFSPLRFVINSVRVYLGLIKIYKEKKIFITVKNLILDHILEQFSKKLDFREHSLMSEINKRQEFKLDLSIEHFSIILPKLFTFLTHLNNTWKNYFADILFLEINRTNFTNSNNLDLIIKERFTNLKILLFLFSQNYKFINVESNLRKNGILHSAFIKNISDEILNLMQQLHESFKALLIYNDTICTNIEKNLSLEKLITKRLSITQPGRLPSNSAHKLEYYNKHCRIPFEGFAESYKDNLHNNSKLNQSSDVDSHSSYTTSLYPIAYNADPRNAFIDGDKKNVCLRRLTSKIKVIVDEDLYQMLGKNSMKLNDSYKLSFKDGFKFEISVKGKEKKYFQEKNKNTVEIINELLEERTGNKGEKLKDGFHGMDGKKILAKIQKIEKEILEGNLKEMSKEILNLSRKESNKANKEKESNKAKKEKEVTINDPINYNEKILEIPIKDSIIPEKVEIEVTEMIIPSAVDDDKLTNEIIKKCEVTKKENEKIQSHTSYLITDDKAPNFVNFQKNQEKHENSAERIQEDIYDDPIRKNNEKIEISENQEKKHNPVSLINNYVCIPIADNNLNFQGKQSKRLFTFDNNSLNEIINENLTDKRNSSLKIEKDNYRYGSVERNFQSTNKEKDSNNHNDINEDIYENINDKEYNTLSKSLISSNDSKISVKSVTNDNQCLNRPEPAVIDNHINNDLQSESGVYDSKVNYSDGNYKMRKIRSLMELKLVDYQDFMSEPNDSIEVKKEEYDMVHRPVDLDNVVDDKAEENQKITDVCREQDNKVGDDFEEENEIDLLRNVKKLSDGNFKELKEIEDRNSEKCINLENKIKKIDENKLSLEKILEKKNNQYRKKMLARKDGKISKDELKKSNIIKERADSKSSEMSEENPDVRLNNKSKGIPDSPLNNINRENPYIDHHYTYEEKRNKLYQEKIEFKPNSVNNETNDENPDNKNEQINDINPYDTHEEMSDINPDNRYGEITDVYPDNKHKEMIDISPDNINEEMADINHNNIYEEKQNDENEIDRENSDIKPNKLRNDKPNVYLNDIIEKEQNFQPNKISQEKQDINLNHIRTGKPVFNSNKNTEVEPIFNLNNFKTEMPEIQPKEIQKEASEVRHNEIKEELRDINPKNIRKNNSDKLSNDIKNQKKRAKLDKINEVKPEYKHNDFKEQKSDLYPHKIKTVNSEFNSNKIQEDKHDYKSPKIQEDKHDYKSPKIQEDKHDYKSPKIQEDKHDYKSLKIQEDKTLHNSHKINEENNHCAHLMIKEEMNNYNGNSEQEEYDQYDSKAEIYDKYNSEDREPENNQNNSDDREPECNQNNSNQEESQYNNSKEYVNEHSNSDEEEPNYNHSSEEMNEHNNSNQEESHYNNSKEYMNEHNNSDEEEPHYNHSKEEIKEHNNSDEEEHHYNHSKEEMNHYNRNNHGKKNTDYHTNRLSHSKQDFNKYHSDEKQIDNVNVHENKKPNSNFPKLKEEKPQLKLPKLKEEQLESELNKKIEVMPKSRMKKINDEKECESKPNKLKEIIEDDIPITKNEINKLNLNKINEDKLHFKRKSKKNEALDSESKIIQKEKDVKPENKQNKIHKANNDCQLNTNLKKTSDLNQEICSKPFQEKEHKAVKLISEKEDVSPTSYELKEQDKNFKNEKYDIMIEETLENILIDNLLDEYEDSSKYIEDLGDEVTPAKEIGEKLENNQAYRLTPIIETIKKKQINRKSEFDKLKEVHRSQLEGINVESVNKIRVDLDDKLIATLSSISLESIKKEDEENKVVVKSIENFSGLDFEEKIEEPNEKNGKKLLEDLEVGGRDKERKNSKKKLCIQIAEGPLEKKEILPEEKKRENSKEILQDLIDQIRETPKEKLRERVNNTEALRIENDNEMLDEDETIEPMKKRKKTIEEKLQIKLEKKSEEFSMSQEIEILAKKAEDKSEIKLKPGEEILVKSSTKDQLEEITERNNKQDSLEINYDHFKNDQSDRTKKILENTESDSKKTNKPEIITTNNDHSQDSKTKRRTHRKLLSTKIRAKKALSLERINPESINLNDEDYNNIIPKQSADLSLIYLDLNNHIMNNFESDLATPTFVKQIENKISYNDRSKDEDADQMRLDTDTNKDLNVSFKKETEDECEEKPANMNYSQYYSSLRSRRQEVVHEVEPEYEEEDRFQHDAEALEEQEEPTLIQLGQLLELDRQMKLIKANLNELSFLNYMTETTSDMFMRQDIENNANFPIPNEERENFKFYSDILGELDSVITDFPEILKY